MFNDQKASPETIRSAITQWQALADEERQKIKLGLCCGSSTSAYARIRVYERTVKALEIELETGVAVCSCCHKPFGRGALH